MSDRSASKKYAVNTGWFMIEKLCRIISGVLVGILVARYLGPEQFGTISYALNLINIFIAFFFLGMDNIIVRELIIRKDAHNMIMGTGFWLRLAGAFATVLGATCYSFLSDGPSNAFIVFLVSTSVSFQAFTVIDFYFQSVSLGKYTAISQVITLTISSIIKINLIYVKAPLEFFALMTVLEAFLITINQFWFYAHNKKKITQWQFSWQEVKLLLGQSWPIIIVGLVMTIYQKMDQVLIKRLLDLNSLGNYAAAARISEASYFIPTAVCAAIFPGILNNRYNRELQQQRLKQLYSIMLWSSLVMSISGFFMGDYMISMLYREKYQLAPELFKILIWNLIPVFYTTAWGVWMVAENKQRYMIFFQVMLLLIAITLNMILMPVFGAKGAAYALIITQFSSIIISLTIYNPLASWLLFLEALNPKNIFDVFRYVRGKN